MAGIFSRMVFLTKTKWISRYWRNDMISNKEIRESLVLSWKVFILCSFNNEIASDIGINKVVF